MQMNSDDSGEHQSPHLYISQKEYNSTTHISSRPDTRYIKPIMHHSSSNSKLRYKVANSNAMNY